MSRSIASLGLAAVLLLASAGETHAQRKGFIIGGGLGPGVTFGDLETKWGVTSDFKIGGMIGTSLQLYYRNSVNFSGSGAGYDLEGTGVGGLGATYQMDNGFRINGVVGVCSRIVFSGSDTAGDTGFGAGAGVGYEFAKHWVINLDGSWGRPGGSRNALNAALTVNVLSY